MTGWMLIIVLLFQMPDGRTVRDTYVTRTPFATAQECAAALGEVRARDHAAPGVLTMVNAACAQIPPPDSRNNSLNSLETNIDGTVGRSAI